MNARIKILALLLATTAKMAAQERIYRIETNQPQQTIEHFGASDAWSMNYLGRWPKAEQEKIADWLFSLKTDKNGKPKGIGLSLWRFNLGAGSAEQGANAKINANTRTECVMNPDGTYDWNKQLPERGFLKMAKARGVPYFHAFLNSAPVFMTQNGLGTNTGRGGTINLKPDKFDDFARYMATALKGIEQRDGIHFNYISPVNEPDGSWNWQGPKQEGSPATNREIAKLAKLLAKQLKQNGQSTKVVVSESSDLRCLLENHQTDWQRGCALNTFFSPDSTETYLGHTPQVAQLIAAHSYWTNTPVEAMKGYRIRVRERCKQLGVDFWQTEICIMSNDKEIGGGTPYDYSMLTALYVARVIHHDLVYGNAKSWSWWRAVGGNYRDGLIRTFDNPGRKSGFAVDSKLLWSLGNYSRFVRPGAIRYNMTAQDGKGNSLEEGTNDVKGVMASAYRNKDGHWVIVALNYSEHVKPFTIQLSNGSNYTWQQYRTSNISTESLAPIGYTKGRTELAPRSITTFVSQ